MAHNNLCRLILVISYLSLGCGAPPQDVPAPMPDPSDGGADSEAADDVDAEPDAEPDAQIEAGLTCDDLTCGPGQRCEMSPDARCVNNGCADLGCPFDTLCVPSPDGAGNLCVDNRCMDDVDCSEDSYCSERMVCEEDQCVPGALSCSPEGNVIECAPNGSGTFTRHACGLDDAGASLCREEGGSAFCPCEDDWSCPEFTHCDVDRCVGSGMMPACFLPPAAMAERPPAIEVEWGGRDRSDRAATAPGPDGVRIPSPFPDSNQSVTTPIVINLDDDNGDGLINERDFPEVVFTTFCGDGYNNNGVLRAIHGGGPSRGQDFFATCGDAHWEEGDLDMPTCDCRDATLNPTGTLAAGDIDGDGVPEIVVIEEGRRVALFSNRGVQLAASTNTVAGGGSNASVSIANVDGQGLAEIVVGRNIMTLDRDPGTGAWSFVDTFSGSLASGENTQGPISCVADLDGDGRAEVIGGSTAYRFPTSPVGVTRISECTGAEVDADEVAFCRGELPVLWDGELVNGSTVEADGFCAVADVWGADPTLAPGPANPLDGVPEVLTIRSGKLHIFRASDGMAIHTRDFGGRGGAPNVDDFDGDGFPEIGTAFAREYLNIDLQTPTAMCPEWTHVFEDGVEGLQGNAERAPPSVACAVNADCGDVDQYACNAQTGSCVCLHNGWRRQTEDNSSQVTGSSVFDFNGDGAAEVVYNDECYFRIYGGLDGTVYFKENAPSRTRTENPVVADADNDGNAEIIFATSNESGYCSGRNNFNNGLEIWGDPRDEWVGARRIYNQHSYHVTNVTEGGQIPMSEPASWSEHRGRRYNSYRSQPRNLFGIAPDLAIPAVQFSSPDAMCGALSDLVTVTVRVVNQGDLRVGADVPVTFMGTWTDEGVTEALYADMTMTPLRTTLGVPLEAGGEVLVSVLFDAAHSSLGTVPDEIEVIIDQDNAERECDESNNRLAQPVVAGEMTADLTIELGAVSGTCPVKTIETTVGNIGSREVRDVVVRYYVGDPRTGGLMIHEELVPGPIEAGGASTFTATLSDVPPRSVVIFALVDPEGAILECNDANNRSETAERVDCEPELI